MPLESFSHLKHKEFWNLVDTLGATAETTVARLFSEAVSRNLTQAEAEDCLNALFIDSHRRIREHSSKLAKFYPTAQRTPNRLQRRDSLWWVDHFTAGISEWSTLSWFSSRKIKKKSGNMGYAGASTHFILGHHGLPFYIIPLNDGAWHEPRRNRDSISIEMVNAGPLHMKDNGWHYWARSLPTKLVKELPPVRLDKPYRGVSVMQPFTLTQLKYNALLKKIILAALPGKLIPERFSQHSDWRSGKFDMGPLWPFEDVNAAALTNIPLEDWSFYDTYSTYVNYVDQVGEYWKEEEDVELSLSPEYGDETPTHDDDPDAADDSILGILHVQKNLNLLGYAIDADGIFGPQTKRAVINFQRKWNRQNQGDALAVDGIPGPKTCSRILKMMN